MGIEHMSLKLAQCALPDESGASDRSTFVNRVEQSACATEVHQTHITSPLLPEFLEQLGMSQSTSHAFLCQDLVIDDHRP